MDKMIQFLHKIMHGISAVFFTATIILIPVNVIMRAVFRTPIAGVYEITGLFTVTFGSAAILVCAIQDGHISVDILTAKLKGLPRLILAYFSHIVDILYYGSISFFVASYGYAKFLTGESTALMHIPTAPFRIWMSFCFMLMVVLGFCKIIKTRRVLEEEERIKRERVMRESLESVETLQ